MKSPSSRYLTGYVLRTILGTFLLLCAISAARICWIGQDACGEIAPPWDKALILPDRLVRLAIARMAEKRAPLQPIPLAPQPTVHSPQSTPLAPQPTVHSPQSTPLALRPAMPDMPELPAMPAMPAMPSMPSMPDMPAPTAGTSDLPARHAELLTAINAREKQLRSAAANGNPHRAEYVAASQAYKQFALRNNALLKEYEDATGERRMELADELRTLKLNRDTVTETYRSAKQKYTTWKEQHPETEPDLGSDPELQRLRQQLATTAQQLAAP